MMNKTLYLVSCEGYYESYGSYTYLIGIFDSKEKAEAAKKNAFESMMKLLPVIFDDDYYDADDCVYISEIPLNKHYELMKDDCRDEVSTDIGLGGYME